MTNTHSPISILVLEGDGIGPEICAATMDVVEAALTKSKGHVSFIHNIVGLEALSSKGTTMPDEVLAQAKLSDGIILGPVSHNIYPEKEKGGINPSGTLRKDLDLFANIRPAETPEGFESRLKKKLDMVIFRENTEGFYADRNMSLGSGEFMPTEDTVISMRRITRHCCHRIAKAAFETARLRLASGRGQGKVTAVHKANVLRLGCGLFLEEVHHVAKDYPEIVVEEIIVDAMCAHLVRHPERFDVVVTTNMFGDILSDLATELSGSLGLAASLNLGDDKAMAQAQHGSAPDIAGQNKANPSSLMLSAGMLLEWLGQRHQDQSVMQAGHFIMTAVANVLKNPATRTTDMGGELTTSAYTQAIVNELL